MSDPTTLYEYYTSKGNTLPTISTRGQIFEKIGLGSASEYTGTATQNNLLLATLLQADLNYAESVTSPDSGMRSIPLLPDQFYNVGPLSLPLSSLAEEAIRLIWGDNANEMISLANNPIYWNQEDGATSLHAGFLKNTLAPIITKYVEMSQWGQSIQNISLMTYTPTELTWTRKELSDDRYGSFESPAYDYDSDTDHWTIAGTTQDKLDNISPEDTKFYVGEERDEMLDQAATQTAKTVVKEFIESKMESGFLSLFTRSETIEKLYDKLKSFFTEQFDLMDKGTDMTNVHDMSTSEQGEQFNQEVEGSHANFQREMTEFAISETGTEGGVLNKILSSVRTIIRHSDTQFIVEDASLIPQYQTPDGHHVEIIGAAAGDDLYGGNGNDTLIGQYNSDKLAGGSGNDFVIGGDGNDNLDGGDGDDILVGGSGNDVLHAGVGLDDLTGGGGNDSFSFYAAGDFTVQDFNKSVDLLVFESTTTGLHNIGDLVSVITSIEDNSESVTIHFIGDVASITLIGLHQDDLSGDMVGFA